MLSQHYSNAWFLCFVAMCSSVRAVHNRRGEENGKGRVSLGETKLQNAQEFFLYCHIEDESYFDKTEDVAIVIKDANPIIL